jgi:hypothetical protein
MSWPSTKSTPIDEGVFHASSTRYSVTTTGVGTEELIGVIDRGFPTPLRYQPPMMADLSGDPMIRPRWTRRPVLAESSAPPPTRTGRQSMVRVFSGTRRPIRQFTSQGIANNCRA